MTLTLNLKHGLLTYTSGGKGIAKLTNAKEKCFGIHYEALKEVGEKLPDIQKAFHEAKTEGEDEEIQEIEITNHGGDSDDVHFLLALSRYKTAKYLFLKCFKKKEGQRRFIGTVRLSDQEPGDIITEVGRFIEFNVNNPK